MNAWAWIWAALAIGVAISGSLTEVGHSALIIASVFAVGARLEKVIRETNQ